MSGEGLAQARLDEIHAVCDRTYSHKALEGMILTPSEEALLDLERHVKVLQQRNENLSQQYRMADKMNDGLSAIVSKVADFANSLDRAITVAESGVLVGEVHAMKCIREDLLKALTVNDLENDVRDMEEVPGGF
ncbi:hypothetical protein SEA_MACGULLY_14 [Rhodococcus phage MacGully]|nr:hypothetical protein SEA_MACGULLY_14 [Rhodococcus phage MacGully]